MHNYNHIHGRVIMAKVLRRESCKQEISVLKKKLQTLEYNRSFLIRTYKSRTLFYIYRIPKDELQEWLTTSIVLSEPNTIYL